MGAKLQDQSKKKMDMMGLQKDTEIIIYSQVY